MTSALFHHEQQWSNSCVSACIGIVRKWRGETFDEAVLHAGASTAGHGLRLAAETLNGSHHALGPEEFLERAPLWLADERRW